MRLVFLFFLLLNAAYFVWQSGYFREPSAQIVSETAQPAGVASLTLLRERGLGGVEVTSRPAKPLPATAEVPALKSPPPPAAPSAQNDLAEKIPEPTPPVAEPSSQVPEPNSPEPVTLACFTFGPFDKEATMNKAMEAFIAAGAEVKRRQVEQRTPRAYWVYLAPMESYGDALKMVKELRKKGINDLFIMGKGEKQNAISLGLFSNKATADQRNEEVMALGMQPLMETQYRTSMLDWLDIEVDSRRTTTIATITAIADDFITANLSQRDCE